MKAIEYKLDTVIDFGKHTGKKVSDVIAIDPTYIYWMYDKKFNLSLEVRRASNKRTSERRTEAGLKSVKSGNIGFREQAMLNHLVDHLNNKHFDHAIDEEDISAFD